MGFSVNTNVGAMAALQSLNETNKGLATTQSRINTGLAVSSTKDDSASYTIAQTLRGEMGGLKSVSSSLSRAKSTVDVAVAGAEQISDVLNQMKEKATVASDQGLDEESRKAVAKDFTALRDQIKTIIDSSEFNGTNLLKASGGDVKALQSTDTAAATLDVTNIDMSTNVLDELDGLDADDSSLVFKDDGDVSNGMEGATLAKTMVTKLESLQKTVNGNLSTLGAASRKIDGQSTFVSKLSDVIEAGIGNLVDADLAKESAKLQALQVKQQLGVQALSIANQAPQTITSLFR
ncbi:MAG: flagellin [Sphingomonas sp.]|uniref:flagellin n=1 Tax=Sphingomonas sp. TaxID=28214 RepID=UPI001B10D334|nr:flagellin [Sphingomonas sp.]MBO9623748.1 flagellin [Sphingomonas sp.]